MMSCSVFEAASEGIDGVGRHGRTNMGLERVTADDVHRSPKESRDVFLQSHIVENGDASVRLDVDDDIEVAVRSVISARDRSEHAGMADTACAQVGLVAAQGGKGVLSVHEFLYSTTGGREG